MWVLLLQLIELSPIYSFIYSWLMHLKYVSHNYISILPEAAATNK